ncbi:phage integrase family protein [Cystobacter fuscus]|uniref:Phage integrase family protein n=1 Tax=Cystobacter fuscus TaxID=43 RepID=A0A250IYG0_9BACT|nr:site-specific integrase [Cystobacter fuscus]ATB36278.1 phage integrase family protein [Cystobacter fuscus]
MGAKRNPKSKSPAGRKRAAGQEELPLDNNPTLGQVTGWYERTVLPHLAKRTGDSQRSVLRQAVAALPTHPDGRHLVDWLHGRMERGELMASSANKALKVLKHVYRRYADHRWCPQPFARVRAFPEENQAPRSLEDADTTFPRFLAACRDDRERAWLCVLRYLGLRRGEVLGLEPRHLSLADLDKATLAVEQQRQPDYIKPGPLKTAKSRRTLMVPRPLAELLKRVLTQRLRGLKDARGQASRRFVFPYSEAQLTELLERLRAAVPGVLRERERGDHGGDAWHVFRHTRVKDFTGVGTRVEDVAVYLGHTNIRHTQGYMDNFRARVVPEDMQRQYWAAHPPVVAAPGDVEVPVVQHAKSGTTGSDSSVQTARVARRR